MLQSFLAALRLCAALALTASPAFAGNDTYYLGTGRNGALTVSASGTTINSYSEITAPVAPGDVQVQIADGSSFVSGDLVLVLQFTGVVPEPPSGAGTPVDLSGTPVGRFELARVASVAGAQLSLSEPLLHAYAANVSQVIRVPEYTSVTVQAGASITGPAWDGVRGGVVALLATGTVTLNGTIDASQRGLRGGAAVAGLPSDLGCSGLDEPAPRGAARGEGIAATRFGASQTGRGNVANGGGGGVCRESGGGGGGHRGAGGKGGRTNDLARDVGGLGGATLTYTDGDARLHPGGGGGAGHGPDAPATSAGRGGGIVFLRAAALAGSGQIRADGGAGHGANLTGGAGGGGAGGTVVLRIAGNASCGGVFARGGSGGSKQGFDTGPGGGGGGGRILLQAAAPIACPANVSGGVPGTQLNTGGTYGPSWGATAGATGVVELRSPGYALPPAPTVTSPVQGSFIANRRPAIIGSADPGDEIEITIDGVMIGAVTVDAGGNFSLTPGFDLDEGLRAVRARALRDGAVGPETLRTFSVDVTPPDTGIVSAPPALAASASATFDFSANEASVAFECSLDGAPFAPCTDPATFSGLADGAHALHVRAVDAAGNIDPEPASYAWSVDTQAPDTAIVSAPPTLSSSTSATFDFDADEAPVSFDCSLDGAPFSPCTDPATFTGLADGVHALQVRAVDAAGNADPTPASHAWTVDTQAPDTSIVSAPPAASASSAATFDFASDDPSASFECSLDAAAFAPCTDPATFSGLEDGTHALQVRALDLAGNADPTPAAHGWNVDTQPPDTSIVSGPPALSSSDAASFDFDADDPAAAYECSLDGAAFGPCTDPATFTGLAEGAHTLQARAVDAAGNADPTPASYAWEVDTLAPDTFLLQSPPVVTAETSATVEFTGDDPGASFECRLDAAPFAPCVSPVTVTGLSEGPHAFAVRAIDAAGNVDPSPAEAAWEVDLTPPDTTITRAPADGSAASVTFEFAAAGASGFECSLDVGPFAACTSPLDLDGLELGLHLFEVRARDAAGNVDPSPAMHAWSVSERVFVDGFEPSPP